MRTMFEVKSYVDIIYFQWLTVLSVGFSALAIYDLHMQGLRKAGKYKPFIIGLIAVVDWLVMYSYHGWPVIPYTIAIALFIKKYGVGDEV